MGNFADRIRLLALALGAPGLFFVAFLDSSVLSLPEIADLLIVYMVVHHKARFLLYATAATAGSIGGCVFLYLLARAGEERLIRKRFTTATVEKTLGIFRRWGLMAVLIPSLLPPPAPFKIFVLLAGVGGITLPRFAVAVAIGRGLRYFVLGLLAIRYGDRAIAYLHENGARASLVLIALLAAGTAGYVLWSRAKAREAR
jgi:membrane protein YqaA with SNARE-associated domain